MHNMAVAYVHDEQWNRARYWVRQALLVDHDDLSLRRLRMKLRLHTLAEALEWCAVKTFRLFFRYRTPWPSSEAPAIRR
jgi:hypothetical protein